MSTTAVVGTALHVNAYVCYSLQVSTYIYAYCSIQNFHPTFVTTLSDDMFILSFNHFKWWNFVKVKSETLLNYQLHSNQLLLCHKGWKSRPCELKTSKKKSAKSWPCNILFMSYRNYSLYIFNQPFWCTICTRGVIHRQCKRTGDCFEWNTGWENIRKEIEAHYLFLLISSFSLPVSSLSPFFLFYLTYFFQLITCPSQRTFLGLHW